MAKLRLTKNELKKQKEALKRFDRYLPMLSLKKKQLRLEITKIQHRIKEVTDNIENLRNDVVNWVDVFAQELDLTDFLEIGEVKVKQGNVAGIDLPIFSKVEFKEKEYDLLKTPLWIDKGVEALKEIVNLKAELEVYHRQVAVLKEELRTTTQRINLFEKVKIPEAKESIRIIQISLGELQTAEVIRGKIAKSKIEKRKTEFAQ